MNLVICLVGNDGKKIGSPLDALPTIISPEHRLLLEFVVSDVNGSVDHSANLVKPFMGEGYGIINWSGASCMIKVVARNGQTAMQLLEACMILSGGEVCMVMTKLNY